MNGAACEHCGFVLGLDELFCQGCGRPVESASAEPTAPRVPGTPDTEGRLVVDLGGSDQGTSAWAPDPVPASTPSPEVAPPPGTVWPSVPVAATVICGSCGSALEPDSAFCISCGAGVDAGPSPRTTAAPVGRAPSSGGGSGLPTMWIAVGAAGLVVVVLVAFGVSALLGGDDGPGAGSASGMRTAGDGPSSEPEEEDWSADVDCEYSCTIGSVGSLVVVAEHDDDGRSLIRAFRPGEDKELWEERVRSPVEGFVVLDGFLLVSMSGLGGSKLIAFDPATGQEVWDAEPSRWMPGDGVVLLGLYDADDDETTTRAVSFPEGDELWEVDGHPAAVCGSTALVIDDDDVLAYRLAKDADDDLWKRPGSTVACAGDHVAVVDDGEVIGYRLSDGEEQWDHRVRDASGVQAVGDLFLVSADDEVLAFPAAGAEDARWEVDAEDWGYVYLDGGEGRALTLGGEDLILFDLATGDELESRSAEGWWRIGPSTVHVWEDDELVSYRANDLAERWEMDVDDDAVGLAISDSRVFVLFEDEVVSYG